MLGILQFDVLNAENQKVCEPIFKSLVLFWALTLRRKHSEPRVATIIGQVFPIIVNSLGYRTFDQN